MPAMESRLCPVGTTGPWMLIIRGMMSSDRNFRKTWLPLVQAGDWKVPSRTNVPGEKFSATGRVSRSSSCSFICKFMDVCWTWFNDVCWIVGTRRRDLIRKQLTRQNWERFHHSKWKGWLGAGWLGEQKYHSLRYRTKDERTRSGNMMSSDLHREHDEWVWDVCKSFRGRLQGINTW